MACERGYKDWVSCGLTEIIFSTGIPSVVVYDVVITNKGSKYFKKITSDIFGDITIPFADYPDGLFNPYAGTFTIEIPIGCGYIMFCDEYTFLQFEVVNGVGSKNTITCCPSGSSTPDTMQCCTTTTIPFTNQSIVSVPYTGQRPSIQVAYLQPDGSFIIQGIAGQISFSATEFTIDNGGPATGIVQLKY